MFNLSFRKSPAIRTIEPSLRDTFTEGEIASMANLGTIVHVSSGDDLIVEGTEGTHAYFVVTGSAAVRRGDNVLAMLRAGDLVGERALVTHQLRNATVTALMPVTALQLDRDQFAWLRLESQKLKTMANDLVSTRG